MPTTNESGFEDLEVYRTALELRCLAKRIERALPPRKQDVKEKLLASTASVLSAIERGENPMEPLEQCGRILGRLQMVELGGKADVTAGVEIAERVVFLLQENRNCKGEAIQGKGNAVRRKEENGSKGEEKREEKDRREPPAQENDNVSL